jgi:hypothetical protein
VRFRPRAIPYRLKISVLRINVQQAVLEALFADFKDIARTARAIALDEPDFPAADFRHPADYTETAATTQADALLAHLEDQPEDTTEKTAAKAALRAKFIAYEIPADFVEDLRADRDALDTCNAEKHSDRLEGVQSTASIDTLLSQAQQIITRLDAAVQNKYRQAPDKLAAWKSASHTERAPRKSKPAGEPAPA